MKEFIGNPGVVRYFLEVLNKGTLAHAYCFSGVSHVGKTYLAEILASHILGRQRGGLSVHPDMVYVSQEKNHKTGKTKKYIDIAQIRQLNKQVSRAPVLGKSRVVIIHDADCINEAGFNALLKTIEEPRSDTYFFFLVENYDNIPKTIQSRCHHIYFSPPKSTEIAILQAEDSDEDWALKCEIARQLPGLLVTWKNNPETYQNIKREVERCEKLFFCCFDEKLRLVEDIFGEKKDHIRTRKHLMDIVGIWQIVCRRIMKKNSISDHGVRGFTQDIICAPTDLVKLLDMLAKTKILLKKNIHPKVLFEQLLLHIP